jgi:hypothetical protein
MTDRQQITEIEGFASSALRVSVGVPQGSILGPLWYVIYTNELPEVLHGGHCPGQPAPAGAGTRPGGAGGALPPAEAPRGRWWRPGQLQPTKWRPRTGTGDAVCGSMTCYADDSSCYVSRASPEALSEAISAQYTAVSEFLTSSILKVNDDKTHTMLLSTNQMRKSRNLSMTVEIGTEQQRTTEVERLLGLMLHHNLKFKEHIQDNSKSLLKSLNTRLNALKMIRRTANFKQRLSIANGIFYSKIVFLISVWGGTEEYLLNALQVVMNKAARAICKVGKGVSTGDLLAMVKWLSVRQAVAYYSLMEARRVVTTGEPRYLYDKLVGRDTGHATRGLHGGLRAPAAPRLSLARSAWRHRVLVDWQRLPLALVELPVSNKRDQAFRSRLRAWVKLNVDLQ